MYRWPYSLLMPTALKDMQPWRRAIVVAGLTYAEVASATGKSVDTVQAYAIGRRTPKPEWTAAVLAFCRERAA